MCLSTIANPLKGDLCPILGRKMDRKIRTEDNNSQVRTSNACYVNEIADSNT